MAVPNPTAPAVASRVLRGVFPDRAFDVAFWQAQGDSAIFEAALEMVRFTQQAKGVVVRPKSDLPDLLRLLTVRRVRYLIVGGYAVMKYTEPFYTKYLDIWIDSNAENVRLVFQALAEFGAPI